MRATGLWDPARCPDEDDGEFLPVRARVHDQAHDRVHDQVHDQAHDRFHDRGHDRVHDRVHASGREGGGCTTAPPASSGSCVWRSDVVRRRPPEAPSTGLTGKTVRRDMAGGLNRFQHPADAQHDNVAKHRGALSVLRRPLKRGKTHGPEVMGPRRAPDGP